MFLIIIGSDFLALIVGKSITIKCLIYVLLSTKQELQHSSGSLTKKFNTTPKYKFAPLYEYKFNGYVKYIFSLFDYLLFDELLYISKSVSGSPEC